MSVTDVRDIDRPEWPDVDDTPSSASGPGLTLPLNSHFVRQKAIAYIDQHLVSPELRPSSVAEGVHVSRAVLYRAFQHDGGVAAFLHERRLTKARLMLKARANEPGIVHRVASAHGYVNAARFSRLFASRFAEQPAQFVQKIRSSALVTDVAECGTTELDKSGLRAFCRS